MNKHYNPVRFYIKTSLFEKIRYYYFKRNLRRIVSSWILGGEEMKEKEFLKHLKSIKNNFSGSSKPPPLKKNDSFLNTDDGKMYKYNGKEWVVQKEATP